MWDWENTRKSLCLSELGRLEERPCWTGIQIIGDWWLGGAAWLVLVPLMGPVRMFLEDTVSLFTVVYLAPTTIPGTNQIFLQWMNPPILTCLLQTIQNSSWARITSIVFLLLPSLLKNKAIWRVEATQNCKEVNYCITVSLATATHQWENPDSEASVSRYFLSIFIYFHWLCSFINSNFLELISKAL